MKKFYAILFVLFALVSLQTKAQLVCNASFTTQFLSGSTVKFNPSPLTLDSPNVQHYWYFNDGAGPVANNTVAPIHTFPTGTFSVGHVVYRVNPNGSNYCSDSSNQIITITQGACLLSANYYKYSTASNNLQFYYVNYSTYISTNDSIRWTFGDGTSSNTFNTSHTYANYGIYNVCLRVIKRNANGTLSNCISEICRTDTLSLPCNLQAYFTNTPDSAAAPATIQFTNLTGGFNNTDSIRWTFGDGTPYTYATNPSHIYTTPGIYTVCIRVKRNNTLAGTAPCISEFCKQIVILTPTPPCNLLANFTWYRDSLATIPYSYHFINTTLPLAATDSIRWTFGDGTSSNQVNPTHNYTTAGTYNVCLRVIKRNPNGVLSTCISEKCYVVVVTPPVIPCNMQAYFSNTTDSLQLNLIHFTNQTVGYAVGDSVTWTFGDGTSSNQINPNHVYTNAGSYIVCIRVKKNTTLPGTTPCIREFCKTIVVTLPCTLVANFYAYRDSITTIPNAYHFINTSAPLSSTDSIRWTFGDGTSSNQVSPLHFYANQGTYAVCLRVIKRDAAGVLTNCVSEKCYTINVVQLCNISANYTWQADAANYKKINFSNTTVPLALATALWNFGDGSTATTWNATHTYTQPGRYYVCLRIQYGVCVSYKCDTINIVIPISCNQLSNYQYTNGNGQVSFAPTYNEPNVQYTWTFGDGTGAQGGSASHFYNTAGNYTACLTAYRNNNCASTTCNTITILPTINCNNITLGINDTRDSLVPNRVTFTAVSNTPTTSQQWTITRILLAGTGTTTINTNNPTYMFLDSGYYNVCVKATYANGCVKTICKVIHVLQNMPTANNCTLQITPNPASSVINANITLVQPLVLNAYVYNSMNVLVAQKQQQGVVGTNTITMNIAALPAGIYVLRLVYGTQLCYATFIKQ